MPKPPPPHPWQRNVSTGTDFRSIGPAQRIQRQGFGGSGARTYLYKAEHWGDYTLRYPVAGPWRRSLTAATKDMKALLSA